ncbi:MAG: TauD/TfdA family dioxygenase [Candidatus Peregrinibacteria bacterium]|nr:TauD/TfdA family dioxygenase [Candidatus Peregrinibacteria bacterium]
MAINPLVVHTIEGKEAIDLLRKLEPSTCASLRKLMRRKHAEILTCDVPDDRMVTELPETAWEPVDEGQRPLTLDTEFVTLPALQWYFRSSLAQPLLSGLKRRAERKKSLEGYIESLVDCIDDFLSQRMMRGRGESADSAADLLEFLGRETLGIFRDTPPRPRSLLSLQGKIMEHIAAILEKKNSLHRIEWKQGRFALFDNLVLAHRREGDVWHVDSDFLSASNCLTMLHCPRSSPVLRIADYERHLGTWKGNGADWYQSE